jgi:hypothetical protein
MCDRLRMRSAWFVLVLLSACGGGSGDPVPIDAPPMPDAPYDTARCLIQGLYGDLGAKTGGQTTMTGPATTTIVLDPGPPRDSFFLKLNTGKGVFTGGLANGTYTLAGADLGFSTCGACINIVADIGTMGPTKFYFATSGTLTLTSTQRPAGSVQNVTFEEVTASGAVVAGGCTARIDAMTFTTP